MYILYKNYTKNQFDAYFIKIVEVVFEYYQYWLQWISLHLFEHYCSKWFKFMKPTHYSQHYYSEMFNVKCKRHVKNCKVFHDTTYAGVWIW